MRSGVLICRPPHATARWQSQAALVFSHNGFSCQLRQRFDGVLIVAFERDAGQADMEAEELEKLLVDGGAWIESTELKNLK